jgi:hypothetical protein
VFFLNFRSKSGGFGADRRKPECNFSVVKMCLRAPARYPKSDSIFTGFVEKTIIDWLKIRFFLSRGPNSVFQNDFSTALLYFIHFCAFAWKIIESTVKMHTSNEKENEARQSKEKTLYRVFIGLSRLILQYILYSKDEENITPPFFPWENHTLNALFFLPAPKIAQF